MVLFARLREVGVSVLVGVALVLWLAPLDVRAYGPAGGATHTADCYSNSSSSFPSYGGCASGIGGIRDGDMIEYLRQLKTASPTYNFTFQAWNVCPTEFSGQVGSCTFYYVKTLISSGADQKGNNGGLNYKRTVTETVDCVGAGYLKVGANCVCAPGYGPAGGGACAPQECPDPGLIPGTDDKKFSYTNMTDGGVSVCFDGCLINGSFAVGYDGGWYIIGPFYNTGQKCNPSNQGGTAPPGGGPDSGGQPPVDDTAKCSPGQCPGTVNGTQVCVACDSTTTGDYHGNGNGGTWSQTTCSNGTCWTRGGTVDQNGNQLPPDDWGVGSGGSNPQANPGGTSGNCTGSDCETQDKFCEENPESILCKSSTWGGTCQSSFSCDGDAVQCAIAREQHERNCTLFDAETELSGKGRAAANGEAQPEGHPFKNAAETSIQFSEKIDLTNRISGSCPAGRSVTVAGVQVVVVTASLCDSLEVIGNVVVALGGLLAMLIVFRG